VHWHRGHCSQHGGQQHCPLIIPEPNGDPANQIVDGGVFENSGTATAVDRSINTSGC
jgi:hypothetical protein